jgi:phosphopantetheinyl transferase
MKLWKSSIGFSSESMIGIHNWLQELGVVGGMDSLKNLTSDAVEFNEEESAYIGRYRNKVRQKQAFASIYLVKQIINDIYQYPTSDVAVVHSQSGRPWVVLSSDHGKKIWPLSISHCGDIVVFMMKPLVSGRLLESKGVGIDAEAIGRTCRNETPRFLCQREAAAISLSPKWFRPVLFTEIWTRKEAISKAVGVPLGVVLEWNVLDQHILVNGSDGSAHRYNLSTIILSDISLVISAALAVE